MSQPVSPAHDVYDCAEPCRMCGRLPDDHTAEQRAFCEDVLREVDEEHREKLARAGHEGHPK